MSTASNIETMYYLTPLQEGLLFHSLEEPESGVYVDQVSCILEGTLDRHAFESAWRSALERHPILRTGFVWEGVERFVQVVRRRVDLPVVWDDLRALPEAERAERIETFLEADVRTPFDLRKPPLMRLAVFRLGETTHHLVWTHHHILLDGWSGPILLQDVFELYEADLEGRELRLPPPPPYRSYVAWLEKQDLGHAEQFWRDALAGFHVPTPLGLDRLRLPGAPRSAHRRHVLSEDASDALRRFAQDHELTLNNVIQAVWGLLLSRWSGERDVVFGAVVSGRPPSLPGVERMVGLFINTLPVRLQAEPGTPFRAWVAEHQTHQVRARDFEHTPLFRVQAWSDVPSGTPLFDTLVVFESFPASETLREREGALDVRDVRIAQRNHYPLTLIVAPGRRVELILDSPEGVIDEATLETVLGQMISVFEQVRADPEIPLDRISSRRPEDVELLPDPRRELDGTAPGTVVDLLEAACLAHAERPAVSHEGRTYGYRELWDSTRRLAGALVAEGLLPGQVVAVTGPRSVGLVVAMCAVFRSGGVLLTLDPELPSTRRRRMLDSADARFLLRVNVESADSADSATGRADLRTWTLDPDTAAILDPLDPETAESADLPPVAPGDDAYVFFTSGSTGVPKGVKGLHAGLGHFLRWQRDTFGIGPEDRSAQLTGLSFDVVLRDVFLPLISGGTLCLPPGDSRDLGADRVLPWLRDEGITVLHTVPSIVRSWLATPSLDASPTSLRHVFFAGEALSRDLVQRFRETFGAEAEIVNLYGPTETTLAKCFYRVPEEPSPGTQPVGRPLPESQALVVGDGDRLAGIGEVGEIVLRTPFVTAGYLDPALGAATFETNPFREDPREDPMDRIYRTGDRGAYRADGELAFAGRMDDQIKVRGVRIEPAEVEAVVSGHPGVRQAAVLASEDAVGQKRLVAYVVPEPRHAPRVGGHLRYPLPNGRAVAHLNKNETDYLFREIFELRAYVRHGLTLEPGDVVLDVGGNIGLFMLFAHEWAGGDLRMHCFEPNPTVFDLLRTNASLYGPDVRVHNFGISEADTTETFTFFPGFSMLSGFYTDAEVEKETIKAFVANQERKGLARTEELLAEVDELLEERFEPVTFDAELKTLSTVLRSEGIDHVDYLKVNVEKSELDVLAGIEAEDWRKIDQVCLEVDLESNLDEIVRLLEAHDFDLVVQQDMLLEGTELVYVYAVRNGSGRRLVREHDEAEHGRELPVHDSELLDGTALRDHSSSLLPEAMVPSAFVLLDELPLTPNGKLDRKALPDPDETTEAGGGDAARPRTQIEEMLVSVWEDVLHREGVGTRDNFFDLGGHSLLATQVVSRLRSTLDIELPLRALFDAPTVERLAERVEAARQGDAGPSMPPLVARAREGRVPLSYAQQRLWFLYQLEPGNPLYNVAVPVSLYGRLRFRALRQSLGTLILRQDALRTRFEDVDGRPYQEIVTVSGTALPWVDLTALEPEDRRREAHRLSTDEARRPFTLREPPLLRAHLVQLGVGEHRILLTVHHIAADGWSGGVVLRDVAAGYEAYRLGRQPSFAELPVRYADFAHWQNEFLDGPAMEPQLDYWRHRLGGNPPTLTLPTDRPRPRMRSAVGGRRRFHLDRELSNRVHGLCRRTGTTPFMVLLAAFNVLLGRLAGQADVVVGTAIANRRRSELEDLVGLFFNLMALRTDLSDSPTFLRFLDRVRDVTLGAYGHQDIPFEKLLSVLAPERDLGRTPLFQTTFVFQNAPTDVIRLPELTLRAAELDQRTANFDFTLSLSEEASGIGGSASYRVDLFDATTIDRWLRSLTTVLTFALEEPRTTLDELPLLTSTERHQLLTEWNDTAVRLDAVGTLHGRFEESVARTPDAVAVVAPGVEWSYADVNRRANRLARFLRLRGIERGDRVAILLERSPEMIPALLAVLKAGGTYVPLEPSYPVERIRYVVSSLGIRIVLTQSALLSHVREVADGLDLEHAVCLDVERVPEPETELLRTWALDDLADQAADDLGPIARSEDPAYVIFTSGSTGKPKGVVERHRPVLNLIDWAERTFRMSPADRVLFVTSLCFDLSVYDVFGLLAAGGSIRVALREEVEEPQSLVNVLCREPITFWDSAPQALQRLTPLLPSAPQDAAALRLVFLSGDWIPLTLPDRVRSAFPDARVIALGGATEATVWSNVFPVGDVEPDWVSIPYGRPIDNARYHVLDPRLEPCPIGVEGDLYIGGRCLSSGYLGAPRLTAEKYVPDPFGEEPGGVLYRTGDRARTWNDGLIEFLGRRDHQVKVRGFRIELGEIESVLAEHPLVQECVVTAHGATGPDETGANERKLVAYVVPDPNGRLSEDTEDSQGAERERLAEWRAVYDETYQDRATEDPTFNTAGWNSSFTGEPIPGDQMRAWVDHTVDRILGLEPRNVLEIGCGTGMLLYRIAPHVETYRGTDISPVALGSIETHLDEAVRPRVTLEPRDADDWTGLGSEAFDTVVINSVTQHFPSVDYLVRVLEQAAEVVADGGAIFVGDVRSFLHLEAFHASVEWNRSGGSLDAKELAGRVRRRGVREEELVISPALFTDLGARLERVRDVQIQLKRGRHDNELNRYRYDVVLRIGRAVAEPSSPAEIHPWRRIAGLGGLRSLLETSRAPVWIRGVPNARLQADRKLLDWLRGRARSPSLGETNGAVEPEDLWQLARELDLRAEVGFASADAPMDVDAVFWPPELPRPRGPWDPSPVDGNGSSRDRWANEPRKAAIARHLPATLHRVLAERLPDYMIPSAVVPLDALPLTANGKLDRRALPQPEVASPTRERSAPGSETETRLVEIWRRVLGLASVGIHDDFFELGGDSISSVQVIAQGSQEGISLTVRDLFERPTIAELAAFVDSAGSTGSVHPVPAEPTAPARDAPASESEPGEMRAEDFPQAEASQEDIDALLESFS